MAQSLEARFNGNWEEVIEYTRVWGSFKAMDKYEVRDYIAFKNFLKKKTGDPNFGLRPVLGNSNNTIDFKHFLDTVVDTITALKKERDDARAELKQARLEIEYLRTQQALEIEPKLQRVMAECET
jgi:hypothetical protein